MKAKLGLCSLGVMLLGSLIFGSPQWAAGLKSWFPNQNNNSQVPDNVLYESIFRLDVRIHNKADQQAKNGETPTPLVNYFKEKFHLSDDENELLHKTAIDFADAVRPTDMRAKEIIKAYRTQFPNGELKDAGNMPKPSGELGELQVRRDRLVLDYRDKLQNALGTEKFGTVDDLVKSDFSKNFRSIEGRTNFGGEK